MIPNSTATLSLLLVRLCRALDARPIRAPPRPAHRPGRNSSSTKLAGTKTRPYNGYHQAPSRHHGRCEDHIG